MKDIVYLIHATGTCRYKIGITSQSRLDKRLKALQTGNAEELVVHKTVITEYASMVERTMHHDYRFKRLVGEWFELDREEIENFEINCDRIIKSVDALKNMGNHYILKQIK